MAVLEHVPTGVRHPLTSRTLVGRSRACELRLASQQVSSVHAELAWDGERWRVHDLGSRNGTHLDGRRLHAEHREPLATGSELVFGTAGERFLLVDASPPGLVVVADDGRVAQAEAQLLCLPSEDDPEVSLLQQLDGHWRLETEQGSRVLVDQDQLTAGGVVWRVHLPGPAQYTDEGREPPMSVGTILLELQVSRDEESLVMRVHHGGRAIELRPRAHDFFLLVLARARLEDQAQAGLAEAEHGWVYRQDLARSLQIDRNLLNLWIYRARRQFTEAGVLDVASLVERRPGSEQLRLGIARLRVRSG